MKLAIPFKLFHELNDVADEFNIEYNPEVNDLDKLGDFLEEFADKTVNIRIVGGVTKKDVKAIRRQGTNVAFRLGKDDASQTEMLQDLGVRFFFDSNIPAYNKVSLSHYLAMGVSDVYIADDLAYALKDTKEACNRLGVRIRMVLNRVPSMSPHKGSDPRSFVIRPDDFSFLDGVVDVAEFDCWHEDGTKYNFSKLSVLHDVFFKKQCWHGDLGELNHDLVMPMPNDTLLPEFTKNKARCGLRCVGTGSCRKCNSLLDIAYAMDKKKWKIKKTS